MGIFTWGSTEAISAGMAELRPSPGPRASTSFARAKLRSSPFA